LHEERLEGLSKSRHVANLARDDDPRVQVRPSKLSEAGDAAVVDDACSCELRGADLEADELDLLRLLARLLRGPRLGL
jgi:hypothetical protein